MHAEDWSARAAYEVVLHTYDVVTGLGGAFALSSSLSKAIVDSPTLWMFDRDADVSDPWTLLLLGSGRAAPAQP